MAMVMEFTFAFDTSYMYFSQCAKVFVFRMMIINLESDQVSCLQDSKGDIFFKMQHFDVFLVLLTYQEW